MRVVLQRVNKANVKVDQKVIGKIGQGILVLVGFTFNDTIEDIEYIINKIINLRIFDDENGIMNKSLLDINGSILSVSQFTLYANTRKGRRPSYDESLGGKEAEPLYNLFNQKLKETNLNIQTGIFGAEMKVELINDGPVTIIIDSKN
ncbi:MAG: D-aminoacyl-tRNA deacylase [Bacilli bacterium]